MTNALAWTPPIGHADIAPSRFERIEGDGYFTLDSDWIVPALLGASADQGPGARARRRPRTYIA